jgi:hypothetical protein
MRRSKKEELMRQIACGCTEQGPSSNCERGRRLFGNAVQVLQDLVNGRVTVAGDEQWAMYTLLHQAYIDHLRGWWEGDVKVQRDMEMWMISIRSCGRWIFHFGAQDELVREWLQVQGYQQFVGMGAEAKDSLSGYYRRGDVCILTKGNIPPLLSPEYTGKPTTQEVTTRVPSQIDLKTQVAISITLLVARIPHSPTGVERLLVQRRAANLLRTHGIQVGSQDERVLQELIEEAIRQKERMNEIPVPNS